MCVFVRCVCVYKCLCVCVNCEEAKGEANNEVGGTCTHSHSCMHAHTYTHIETYIYIHARTHIHTRTNTHSYMHKHTPAHTHAHTPSIHTHLVWQSACAQVAALLEELVMVTLAPTCVSMRAYVCVCVHLRAHVCVRVRVCMCACVHKLVWPILMLCLLCKRLCTRCSSKSKKIDCSKKRSRSLRLADANV
jgi:hypothetical protein